MPGTSPTAPHVLLVDDDAAVAKALAAVLVRAGYSVSVAGSAREAELLLDQRFDALVLDLRMPEMRGDALYYLASARQPWLAERTLFVTGDITEQAEEIIAQTGCELLHKPFRGDMLLQRVLRMAPLASRIVDRAC
ncbi:MAG: response regulator [Gemmatimonadales bacterium]|nr:response regulator [Gemmatimonadota bacterium]MCL4213905.1 response regulator [Gemmatimonadales bacterium]